jgi:formylglycine-generating enzyme required for sulfatase activity
MLSLVYDLGFLLVEGDRFPFSSLDRLDLWPEEERAARLEYENRLLNGALRDPSVRKAIEFLRADPARDDLVARALELLLAPLLRAGGHADAPVVDSVLLRELAPQGRISPSEEAEVYVGLVEDEGALLRALETTLQAFFSQRGTAQAFSAEDLSEIEHWSAFKKPAQRLAGRRIVSAAASFPPVDPRGMKVAEEEEADTELPDSGYYPQGGFSELANRGPIENLHPAELIYMGEDPFGDDPDPPFDLFALRILENEALFFQRDSGQLRRTRRTVHVAIAPDQGLRLKLKWHSDALAVLVYGLVVRLSEDLSKIFPRDALRIELHIVTPPGSSQERAEADRELLRVLLRHEIAAGGADVSTEPEAFDLRALGERERRVYGLAVQSGERPPAGIPVSPPPPLADGAREPSLIVWRVGGMPPGEDEPNVVHMPVEGSPQAALVQARNALLGEIAGVKGRGLAALAGARRRIPKRRRLPRGLRRGERGRAINAKDGSELAWIPPGRYPLGTSEADSERNMLQPERDYTLARGIYMGVHEVTWRQFERFSQETGRTPPKPFFPTEGEHPVHRVTILDAKAYAEWAQLRLPTEEEWEIAARGAPGRTYPWGEEEPTPLLSTYGREPDGREGWTTPQGAHPHGASPFGCQDMTGNLWEWVDSANTPDGGHVVRGGCWNAPPWDCRTFSRSVQREASQYVGFRLARDGA